MAISIHLTLPRTWLVIAVPLALTADTVRQSNLTILVFELIQLFKLITPKMQVLPCFALGFHLLSWAEHFATIHAGAVVQRNAVSVVVLKLVIWAVTATVTGHAATLQITPKEFFFFVNR